MKLFQTLLFIVFINTTYGQWTSSPRPCFGWNQLYMDFPNQEIGIVGSTSLEQTEYYITQDSAKTWQAIDTSFQFGIENISLQHNWGISCGYNPNNAQIDIFSLPNFNKKSFEIEHLKTISYIKNIDSLKAVYVGKTASENYVMGILTHENDTIQLINEYYIASSEIHKINFFDDSTGYLLIGTRLYKTIDFGKTLLEIASNITNFDFYTSDVGIIFKKNLPDDFFTIYKTYTKGNTWEELMDYSEYLSTYIKMTSENAIMEIENWRGSSPYVMFKAINFINKESVYYDFYNMNFVVESVSIITFNEDVQYLISGSGQFYKTYNNAGLTEINTIQNSSNSITVYPVPANNSLHVLSNKNISIKEIIITDSFGKNIPYYSYLNEFSTIDISNLQQGIYHITFVTNSGPYTKKFIKE